MTSGDFEYGPVVDQIASILNENVSGQVAFSYDETPRALNREDLPSTITVPGPTTRDVDNEVGSRASCYMLEGVTLEMVVYVSPVTQGLVGDAARVLDDLIPDIYTAFDARPKLVDITDRDLGQFGDLLYEVDLSHHQAHLSVLVLLARVVTHSHEALETHLGLFRMGDANVIRRPRNAAREVSDLERRLPIKLALHVPGQHLRLVVRKRGVEHLKLVRVAQNPELNGRRVD